MAKRGRRKRTKPDADNSGSGPGRPVTAEDSEPPESAPWHISGGKRQRLSADNDGSDNEEMKQDMTGEEEDDVDVDGSSPPPAQLPTLANHTLVQHATTCNHTGQGNSGIGGPVTGGGGVPVEDSSNPGGFIVKSEPFDPSYEMGDLLLNGSVDSIMDMPLFNEVDSLMNIKHEDHLNDTIFYLPMSYPLDTGVKVEVDSAQVAEATRTLANELAMPNALVYVTPDLSGGVTPITPQAVKQELSEAGSAELLAHLQAPPSLGGGMGGCVDIMAEKGTLSHGMKLTNGHYSASGGKHESYVVNGYGGLGPVAGKGNSKQGSKNSVQLQDDHHSNKDSEPSSKSNKTVLNGVPSGRSCSRQTSQSTSSLSDSSSEEEREEEEGVSQSPPRDPSELSPAVHAALIDDRPEIDRFVICSDHTMECVLCAFTTDSYSAFKSHIICSHPCWRITKKLSKNRLLVERSIKTSTNMFSLSADQVELRTTKAGSTTTTLHAKNDQELQKVLRKYDKNPRKRQLFERNKRLFKCTICLRLFVFEGSVVNHVTDQHGLARPYDHIHISNDHGQKFGPIYRCNQKNCYFSCESENELERHSLERHTQVMYRCQLCGYTADSAEAVRSHGLCMHQQQLMCFDTPL